MGVLLVSLIVVVQAATGALWWALIRRHDRVSALELTGMGIATGTFASMLGGMLFALTPLAGYGWLLPTIILAPVSLIAWRRGTFSGMEVSAPASELTAAAIGLALGGLALLFNISRIPLTAPTTDSFTDLYFFEALSRGLGEFGPTQSILMSGGSLRYHWFAYGWAGDLAQVSGSASFVVITRVLPTVALVAAVALAASWARRLSVIRWAPTLAVLLVVVAGYSGALYGTVLNYDSPSQALTTIWLLAFTVALLAYVAESSSPWTLLLIGALAAACTGGKISHATVAVAGAALMAIVGLVVRAAWWRRAALGALVTVAFTAFTYLLVLAGAAVDRNLTEVDAVKASTWQGLDPFVGPLGVALGTVALLLAILARVAGVGWLLARPESRFRPEVIYVTGAMLAGVGAIVLLREGVNELWFALAASAPAAIVSAAGVGSALTSVRQNEGAEGLTRPLLWATGVALPASLVCLALTRNWTTGQPFVNWLAPLSIWLVAPTTALLVVGLWARGVHRLRTAAALTLAAITLTSIATRPAAAWTTSRTISTDIGSVQPVAPGQQGSSTVGGTGSPSKDAASDFPAVRAAADWVNANTDASDLLATNDWGSAVVPALTGRVMYLSGEPYQVGFGTDQDQALIASRKAALEAFVTNPTVQTARPLCDAGVSYLWWNGRSAVVPDAAFAFSNAAVTIVRLTDWACS